MRQLHRCRRRSGPIHLHGRRRPSVVLATVGGLLAAVLLSACSGNGKVAGSSTTTTSIPPLPPAVIAYVTLAGAGNNLGYGDSLLPVTVGGANGGSPVGTKIRVGTYPDAVAINKAGTIAYVANYTSNTVTPVDLRTGKAGKAIPAGIGPADIAIAPDGKTAYVTDDGSASALGDTVTPIDLATDTPETPIKVGAGPQGIAITPDGSTAYVADAGAIVTGQSGPVGHTVTPIDLATGKAEAPITVGNAPTGVAISPDGSTVFVTNLNSGSVSPISTASGIAGPAIAVQGGPLSLAVAGGFVWVVDGPSSTYPHDNVTPISLATDRAGPPIPIQSGAQDIAITPNGTTAWVTCLTGLLVPIHLRARTVGAPIHVGGGPFGIAIATEPNGGSGPSSPPSASSHRHRKTTKKG
ncbi:MAG TPA: YncE family protein [Acidimicrobiales bacterium]|nr:YncE family protein [Acidimicrobiales bacterium]